MDDLESLNAKKIELEGKITACTNIEKKLSNYSTALDNCKRVISTPTGDTFSSYTFNTELEDTNFINGMSAFVDSEQRFAKAYSSGSYPYTFFRNLESCSSELMSSIVACREEFVRLEEAIEGYKTKVSTTSGNVSTVKTKLLQELESVKQKIASLDI